MRLCSILVAALGVVTCGSFFVASDRSGAAQDAPTVVRVGFTTDDDVTPLIWAQRTKMFERAGIDVQISRTSSGAAVTAGVLAGSYDVGKAAVINLINAHLKGLPVTIIAAGNLYATKTPYTAIIVPKDSTITSGKDFNGKIVASAALRDMASLAISAWVDQRGGDSKTLQFIEIPMSAAGVALAEHRIVAASVTEPYLDAAIASDKVRVLGSGYAAISPRFLISAWFATPDWVAKHPDAAKKFARVFSESAAYINTHQAVTAPVMSEFTGIPLDIYQKLTQRAYIATSLNASDIQPLIDVAAKYGFAERSFPAQELFEPSFGK